jgi:cytochrome c oxidase subunit III
MNAGYDVSGLPTYGYSHRSLTWWATFGMMVIEGMVFVGAIAVYFYLRLRSDAWPPSGEPPSLVFGTLSLVVMLTSAIANQWTKKQSERECLRPTRLGLAACATFGLALLVIRIFEFAWLNTAYSIHAYGSIVFALLALHTVHLLTDFVDTVVLTVLLFTGPLEGRRFVDVSENCLYWWFVVISWIPIYLTIYIAPRIG